MTTRRLMALVVALALLAALAIAGTGSRALAQPPPDPWEVTDLRALGGSVSTATDVNDQRQVVGYSFIGGDAAVHGFLWERGVLTDLGTLGGTGSWAEGINNAGLIAGRSDTVGDVARRAFLWENGVMTDLGTLGGTTSWAFDINDADQVVGWSQLPGDAVIRAFLWDNGVMTDLGTLGGTESFAFGINDAGQVVGVSDVAGDATFHGFVWENGVMTDVGTLGGSTSRAFDINSAGHVVGFSDTTGDAAVHGFVWENGVLTDLGTLGAGTFSQAHGINDAGRIVGFSQVGLGVEHAVIWENGEITDLGTVGGTDSEAWAINRGGQIVGSSWTAGDAVEHGALWEESFYVMADEIGTVYAFPGHKHVGNAPLAPGAAAVDIVINPQGTGYYVLADSGVVHAIGPGTTNQGNLNLATLKPGEFPSAMSLTESGDGYWVFTNLGKAVPFGDAVNIGDVSDLPLVGEIVDAAPYPPGFYMSGADGGVFTPPAFLGSPQVPFFGSVYDQIGPVPLNEPIVTVYVDATDGRGYSLAAGDGGMFNFDSEFCGSIPGILPGVTLNKPVVNAVPYGGCYLFFAADGGAFVFGDKPFLGSLGDNPPANDIVSGDAYAT